MDTSNIPFFVQLKPATFRWPVRVSVPADGKYNFVEFTGVFKYVDNDGEKLLLDPERKRTDKEILAEVLLEVDGLVDTAGAPVPSSPELVAALINADRVAPTALGTYLGARRGFAAEKNS